VAFDVETHGTCVCSQIYLPNGNLEKQKTLQVIYCCGFHHQKPTMHNFDVVFFRSVNENALTWNIFLLQSDKWGTKSQ